MQSNLFWLTAVIQLLVSLWFALLVGRLPPASVTAKIRKLASGQRQDSWLASGVIWGFAIAGDSYVDSIYIVGVAALSWMISRACLRIILLHRETLK